MIKLFWACPEELIHQLQQTLIHKAIGSNLHCIFVDNGFAAEK